ncbi:MAG TPA: DUF3455 domain-containing protein [Acetobacteraceae bacterium]|jgi:hypothetical protein|nr:DUF3455 domain-containing protein [Acetobacteraceae bacterium]
MNLRLPSAVLAGLLFTLTGAGADEPLVPPPPGAKLVFEAVGQGVQIYACEKAGDGYHWVFKAPDAALFDSTGRQVGIHFAGPAWQLADGSKITGEVVGQAPAPAQGAIAWLLLRVKTHAGKGVLDGVDLVRRIDTQGGVAPAGACDAAQAREARMRYTARYLFYAAPR